MIRSYAMYNPLKVFVLAGTVLFLLGVLPIVRFLWFFINGEGQGHLQSIVIGGSLMTLGVVAIMFGAVADLVGRNRQLLEQTLERIRHLEDKIEQRSVATPESGQVAAPMKSRNKRA